MSINSANASFSTREREIASRLAVGLSEKEIANELNISPATVNNHTRNIRKKFGLTKNSEIILAYIADHNKKPFNLSMIREYGISVILVLLNVCQISEASW